jgi:O-antigen ligase
LIGFVFLATAGAFYLRPQLLEHVDLVAAGVVGMATLAALMLYAEIDLFVIGWVLLFPLGYYYVSFPREKSLITFDRILIVLLLSAIFFGIVKARQTVSRDMKKAAVAYAFFIVAGFVSVRSMQNPLGAVKAAADLFLLPVILGYYVICCMDVKRWLPKIHTVTCLMAIYVFVIGAAEFVTGRDLMPFAHDVFFDAASGLHRVNGPFSTNNSYGLIGLITLFFLVFLKRVLTRQALRGGRRLLHNVAIGAAFAVGMMPLFRSMEITLGLVLVIEMYLNKKVGVRFMICGLLALALLGVWWIKVKSPELYEDRVSNPDNFYARVAQQEQTLRLFLAKPINGVGLGDYPEAAAALGQTSFHGVYSVGSAHNTLGNILAETGLTGFIPFVLSQVFLCRAFWNLRKRGSPGAAVAGRFFLYVFLGYWISGLMLTSGYYSDLNFWFVFVTAVLYRYSLMADAEHQANFRVPHEFEFATTARARRTRRYASMQVIE